MPARLPVGEWHLRTSPLEIPPSRVGIARLQIRDVDRPASAGLALGCRVLVVDERDDGGEVGVGRL